MTYLARLIFGAACCKIVASMYAERVNAHFEKIHYALENLTLF